MGKGNTAKVQKVMREYKKGSLRSSSGQPVKSRKQAVAIAMSEAGMSKPKKKRDPMPTGGGKKRAKNTVYRGGKNATEGRTTWRGV